MSLAYDTLTVVLNMVRQRMNDELVTLQPVGGKLLKNTQVYSQQSVNTAWRKFQDKLAERGYAKLIEEVIISNLPIVASADPASQMWIDVTGTYDGAAFTDTPALPEDFSHPLKMWERWSGQNAEFADPPMEKMLDGLPAIIKNTVLRFWEWRNDKIYLVGSQIPEDLRIRYVNYLEDFADIASDPGPDQIVGTWFVQPVPIMRAADSFSWFICAELAAARGQDATSFSNNADGALARVFNLDVRADQRVNIRRRSRSGRGYGRTYP
ncbi:MAG: hypothetical protein WCA44_09185 [Acidobacteriaceae bacterium]